MKHLYPLAILLILLTVGCKSKQTVLSSSSTADKNVKEVIRLNGQNHLPCGIISGKLSISKFPFSMQFRLKKDEKIWISAPLNMAKILIQPKHIQYYNNMDSTYLDADFDDLSSIVQYPLNFLTLQHLLLGKLPEDVLQNSTFFNAENNYIFHYVNGNTTFIYELDSTNFLLKQCSVQDNNTQKTIMRGVFSYRNIEDFYFAESITLHIFSKQEQQTVNLQFKGVKCTENAPFPFSIPKDYSPIPLF